MGFIGLQENVLDKGLCTRCGTCAGICPVNAISMEEPDYFPKIKKECLTGCKLCYHVCPGHAVPFPELERAIFGKNSNSVIGRHKNIYLGYSTEKKIRRKASSGGIVSSLLIGLIESGEIDGAIVLTDDKHRPWIPAVNAVYDRGGVIKAAQSKYIISPVNKVLNLISEDNNSYALVGLPCQIHGIRKLQKIRPSFKDKIKILIGLYCGVQNEPVAIHHLLRRFKIKDYRKVKKVSYRSRDWPGRFEVNLKDGRKFSLSKSAFNYVSLFYLAKRCLWCIDLANELADISVGDGWAKKDGDNKGQGWSVVISRSQLGQKVLDVMVDKGVICLEKISEYDSIKMHAHGLYSKKIGAFVRMYIRKRKGLKIPNYDRPFPKISKFKLLKEKFLIFLFLLFSTGLLRRLSLYIPTTLIENVFVNLSETCKKRMGKEILRLTR